jgi:thymidylate synthase
MERPDMHGSFPTHRGIRYQYGDLNDVVEQLRRDESTRQAYLPIFFPEDTGAVHGGRVPCTLGYLFVMRYGFLHCTYYIRSCDFFRHFRDDVYLACRLTLWMTDQLNSGTPGVLNMHIANLHCWKSELEMLPK